ncbi:hypothetical protein SSCG_00381 [Streptomyces clavuligerus]|nr:hypothetical protein SSCG_00381 [Streptomyces clavuligerus]
MNSIPAGTERQDRKPDNVGTRPPVERPPRIPWRRRPHGPSGSSGNAGVE